MVREGLPYRKERTWYSFSGYSSTYKYIVHNSSLVNIYRGLVERVFCVDRGAGLQRPPRPSAGVFRRRMDDVGRKVSSLVGFCPSMTRQQFVDSYSGSRKKVYERALLSLGVRGLTRQDAYLKTFVKAEKINITLKSDPAPRIIQPRDPRYNVEVGRYLKPLEPRLMKAIDRLWGETTAIKGYTVEKVGAIMKRKSERYPNPCYVGLDASRFDQHCSVDALKWEHSVYNGIIRSPHLAWLLNMQLTNKGKGFLSDGFIRYAVEGCRMSGDMNTSMGNYLIMSCLLYVYKQTYGLDFSLANCGDDCVLFLDKSNLHKLESLPAWFEEMGYTMKVEAPVYDLERVNFCQQQPVLLSRGWTMVRRPDVCLTKDLCVVRGGMTNSRLEDWLRAQRDGGLALYGDCPILGKFYSRFPSGDSHGEQSDLVAPHKFKAGKQCGTITDESRYSFWLAFGLTPDEQLAVERDLESFTPRVKFGEDFRVPTLLDYCTR